MNIKNIIRVDGDAVGVRYHPINRVLLIIGPCKSYSLINTLFKHYFEAKVEYSEIINNKCKFSNSNYSIQRFENALDKLQEQGISIEGVKSFGRLTR